MCELIFQFHINFRAQWSSPRGQIKIHDPSGVRCMRCCGVVELCADWSGLIRINPQIPCYLCIRTPEGSNIFNTTRRGVGAPGRWWLIEDQISPGRNVQNAICAIRQSSHLINPQTTHVPVCGHGRIRHLWNAICPVSLPNWWNMWCTPGCCFLFWLRFLCLRASHS